jgi:hypothetical protein
VAIKPHTSLTDRPVSIDHNFGREPSPQSARARLFPSRNISFRDADLSRWIDILGTKVI